MGEIRDKMLARGKELGFGDQQSKHAGTKVGAAAKCVCVAFVPLAGNREFNDGRGKALAYSHLYSVDFSLDYTELVLTFSGHIVRVKGRQLKNILRELEDHRCPLIEQADPIQATTKGAEEAVVLGLEIEEVE